MYLCMPWVIFPLDFIPMRRLFLDSLEKYRAGRSTFATNLQLLRSWVIRFDEPYLQNQRFFEPYPEVLMELVDSSKGRE